jgi:oxygen-independent coproporphyrinogen III oxidase
MDSRGRFSECQYRPDRRHGRRDLGQLEALYRADLEMSPHSVTIYQMELPFNTVYSQDILGNKHRNSGGGLADQTGLGGLRLRSVAPAGYSVSSAYTMVKDPQRVNFSYRDNLWQGSDLLATGIASFGHISGVHYQNLPEWPQYIGSLLEENRLPLFRALRPTAHQALIREMILQLKRGHLQVAPFRQKFGVDIVTTGGEWEDYQDQQLVTIRAGRIELTRAGLLRVDSLLPAFFEPEHQGVRYT